MAIGDPDSVTAFGALHRELSVLYGKVARSYGLTAQQLELLCLVHKSRPSFGELAAALGCDKTNVTGMVDRLERRELLAREPDPADRRITRAVLTEPGLALRDDIRATLERQLAERLPGAQRERMIDAVATAAAALAESRRDPETH